jgi:peptide/nickel transport system permease protein
MKKKNMKHKNWYFISGASILTLLFLFALIGPIVISSDPTLINLSEAFLPIGSKGHLLGTDNMGRDMLSRLASGTRLSLITAVLTGFCSSMLGILIGIIAGMSSRKVDIVVMRIVELLQSFPAILLCVLLVAMLGSSLKNAVIAIVITDIPLFVALTRSVTLSVKEKDFVKASQAIVNPKLKTIFRHVIPNISPYLISQILMDMGCILITLTSLSFMGLGVQPPTAELGSMLGDLRNHITTQPLYVAMPGVFIALAAIGFNLFGDGLKEAFDIRQR